MMQAVLARPQDDLSTRIATLFDAPVGIGISDTTAPGVIWPEETPGLERAVEARKREFAAGRRAARDAMRAAGLRPHALPMGEDRAPVWPAGMTGSISHSGRICAAAVADAARARGIGLDIEPAEPLDKALIPEVCTLAERAWLASPASENRPWLSRLIFSAKEAAYKCQYPTSRTLFDFHTLEITPDLNLDLFEVTFQLAVPGFEKGARLTGRFMLSDGWIVAAVTLPA